MENEDSSLENQISWLEKWFWCDQLRYEVHYSCRRGMGDYTVFIKLFPFKIDAFGMKIDGLCI